MASIASTISCNDRMSSVLDKIADSLQGLQKSIDSTNDALDKFNKNQNDTAQKNKSSSDSFSSLIKKVTGYASALFSVQTAFNCLKTGINYASDLAEVQNVVDVTFANSAEQVNEWSQNTLQAYGLNTVSAKRYVGTMGAMLKSSGLTEEQALSMSEAMTALAGDMASFYNIDDIDVAFDKIRSGISGETEPLKQLGINMSVANLEAYALAQGIETSYNSMTQAEQAVLRYNYLLDATKDAQGDFSRTQDSWANQTKLLSENWQEFLGTATEGIMTALTPALQTLNSIILTLSANWDTVLSVLQISAGVIGVVVAALAIWKIQQMAVNGTLAATNALLWANPITWVVAGFVAFIAIVAIAVSAVNQFGGTSISVIGVILGVLNSALNVIATVIGTLYNFCVDFVLSFVDLFNMVATYMSGCLDDPIANLLGLLYNFADIVVTSVLSPIAKAIDTLFGTSLLDKIKSISESGRRYVDSLAGASTYTKVDREQYYFQGFGTIGESYNKGYEVGSSLQNAFTASTTTETTYDPMSVYNTSGSEWDTNSIADIDDTDTGENTSAIASNTSKSADSLKWLRELAEQEHIDKYTTAEVVVNFTSNANVTSTQDADSVFGEFSAKLQEAMMKSRAG